MSSVPVLFLAESSRFFLSNINGVRKVFLVDIEIAMSSLRRIVTVGKETAADCLAAVQVNK